MKCKLTSLLIVFLFLVTAIFAQNEGIWKNYSSFSTINDVAYQNGIILGAATGGAFTFNTDNSNMNTFTKSEGLGSQNITAANFDEYGNAWLGSMEGYIFIISDGNVTTLSDIVSLDISSKRINAIIPANGSVYIATDFGVTVLDPQENVFRESYLKFGSFNSNTPVYDIFISDKIYVLTEQGVATGSLTATNLANPASWSVSSNNSSVPFNNNSSIVEFNNVVFVGSSLGLFSQSNGTYQVLGFNNTEILDLKLYNDLLYILTTNRLYSFNGSSSNEVNLEANSPYYQFARGEDLLVRTDSVLTGIDNLVMKNFTPNSPALNYFSDLTIDGDGNIWSVTGSNNVIGGISKFDGNVWSNFNRENTSAFRNNGFHKAFYSSRDDVLYFSNWGRGYTTYSDGQFATYTTDNTPLVGIDGDVTYLVINEIEQDSDGNTWFLNYNSAEKKQLAVKTPEGNWYQYEMASPLTSRNAIAEELVIDQYDTKWFGLFSTASGTPGMGVVYFNDNGTLDNIMDDTWNQLTTSNSGLTDNNITDLVIDARGELWIGTQAGITIVSNPSSPTNSSITSVFPIRSQSVTNILVDPINRKWVGTTTEGVFLLSEDGTRLIANYTTKNSTLPDNNIKSLAIDKTSGVIYIGTDFGLTTLTTMATQPKAEFGDLKVYPNPFYTNSGNEVYIEGLIEESKLKVLTITGKVIRDISSDEHTPGGGTAKWDGKNDSGDFVATGVYLIVAFNDESKEVSVAKIAVIKQ